MNNISIVNMSERHIEAVTELERQCFTSPWSYDAFMWELSSHYALYFVAEEDSNAVGFAGMHKVLDDGYITNIAVSPQHRREGIADSLMQALENHATYKKLALITLEVRETNYGGIHLYEKHGYKQVGMRRNFYTLPTENALLMTKLL